jgi:soluble cytochrome b562
MVEVSETFLQQFVDGLKESAAAQRESAAAQTSSATATQAIATELRALTEETRKGREKAVGEVKAHIEGINAHVAETIDTKMKLANRWPSIWLGLLTIIATVAVGILGYMAAAR